MKYFYLFSFALLGMLSTQLSAQTTYLWSTGATTPTINVNPTVTTTYYVTITHNGVQYLDSLTVEVNSAPSITGQNSICSGGTTQLTGSGTPATQNPWVSSNTNIATVSETGLVTGVSLGSAIITYTNSAGCENTIEIFVTSGTSGVDVISSCSPITWIDGNTYSASNNTATFNIVGGAASGCDSLVTLNFTLVPPPTMPTLACYETATLNTTTCQWEISGTQPAQPTLACWETAVFNSTTCQWDVEGSQPQAPTGFACWQTAVFNQNICNWEVVGTQPTQPTNLECYQTASFNSATCQWEVTGNQPTQPTLACYETATFNGNSCQWEVSGNQPAAPSNLACWETASFNTSTCSWDVSGTQPTQPNVACYQTASFNSATCQWEVTGNQPTQPTLACYETATFNGNSCQWEVSGTPPAIGTDVITSCVPVLWLDGNTYSSSNNTAQFTIVGSAANGCDSLVTLNLTISNSVQGIDQIASCDPIVWIDGNTYSASNYSAQFNIIGGSAFGCDSLVTLNLTIAPCTTLQNTSCNISNVSVNTNIRANNILGALAYRFRITGVNNGSPGWNGNTFILDRPNRSFKFNMAPGVIWGETYNVEVAISMDGINFGAFGDACFVNLEGIPTTQLEDVHCNSINVLMSTRVKANIVTSALGYRFRISGINEGGLGWNGNVYITDRPNREFRFDQIPGIILGQTYLVEVAVLSQNGVDYGDFGPVCSVTIAPPLISLEAGSCGSTNLTLNTKVWAVSVAGAISYRFRIVGTNNGAQGWNGNEFILEKPNREFRFIEVPGSIWGQTYAVQVSSSLDGIDYSPYGLPCAVTLENTPISQLEDAFCGATDIGINIKVRANSVPGAAGYRFRIVGPNTGAAGWVGNTFILDRPNRDLRFVLVPGSIAGQTYSIDVAVLSQDGVTYSPYGAACNVTRSMTMMPGLNPDDEELEASLFEVMASHNPFTTDFGIQVLTNQDYEALHVAIYDMSGKLIERQMIYPLDIDAVRFGRNLASGMYMIEVRQGANQAVLRQVKN